MKREEILAMEPGRELDLLVAKTLWGEWWYNTPLYSTDIAAAWQVVEKFAAEEWNVAVELTDICYRDVAPGRWRCVIGCFTGRVKDQYTSQRAYGSTAPEAICRAALLAVLAKEEAQA